METAIEYESDNEFPDLPPNVMLNLGLEDDMEGNHGFSTLPAELGKEGYPPHSAAIDHSDSSSPSSDREGDEDTIFNNSLRADERETIVQEQQNSNYEVSRMISDTTLDVVP